MLDMIPVDFNDNDIARIIFLQRQRLYEVEKYCYKVQILYAL